MLIRCWLRCRPSMSTRCCRCSAPRACGAASWPVSAQSRPCWSSSWGRWCGIVDRVDDLYERLVTSLDAGGARYRLIDHAPEGRTDLASALRGHDVALAAKGLVVMAKLGKKQTRYGLAVIPGDARLDLEALKSLLGATYLAFASTAK